MGMFDDLIPGAAASKQGAPAGNMFSDLVPAASAAPAPDREPGWKMRERSAAVGPINAFLEALAESAGGVENPAFNPLYAAAKGAREAVAGVSQLPADLGIDTAPTRAMAEFGQALPELPSGGVGNDIASIFLQYGLPAAGAFKAVQGATRALPLTGKLLGATRYGAGITAAGAADAAVTDPGNAETIGDLLGGPTRIDEGDSPLAKRTKVGAETLVAGPVADVVARPKALKGVFDRAVGAFTEPGQRLRVGKILGEAEVSPTAVADAAALNGGGYKATTGTVSNTEKALELERGVATDPRYVQRVRENEKAVSQNVDRTLSTDQRLKPGQPGFSWRDLGKGEAQGDATKQFLTEQRQGMVDAADQNVAQTEADLAGEQGRLASTQGDVGTLADERVSADASATARERLLEIRTQDRRAIGEAYAQVDQDLPADFANTQAAAQQAMREVGETGTVPPILGRLAAEREDKTFFQLQADLRNVNQAIREAQAAGQDNTARVLGIARDGVNRDLDALGANNDALREANRLYREEFAPKYKQGASAEVFKRGRNGAESAVPPSETLDKFLRTPEEAARLRSIMGNDPASLQAVEAWFINDMASVAPRGNIDAARVRVWLNRRGPVLDQFPQIRNRIQTMANNLGRSESAVADLERSVKDAGAARKMTEKDFDSDATRFFVDGDPVEAVGKALGGDNAAESFQQLAAAARKDPSGRALEGLRNATREHINRKVRNTGAVVKGDNAADSVSLEDLKVSFDKLNKMLIAGSPERKAMEQVFSPDDMAALDKYRKQLEVSTRKDTQGVTGSNTTSLLSAAAKSDGVEESVLLGQGTIRGQATNRILRFFAKNVFGDVSGKIRKLLVDAVLDPELARTLMLEYTKSTEKVVERRLHTYITNNMMAAPGEKDVDDDR